MSDIVREYKFYLNSKQRNNGTSNNFNITIYPPMQLLKQTNYFRIRVLRATIPYSFSQVNNSNNTFYVGYNSVVIPIVVAPGNYNIIDLNTQIQSLILAALPTVVLTINYTRSTGLNNFTLVAPGNLILYAGSTIAKMLGITSNITLIPNSVPIYGNQKVDVNPILSIFIRSDTVSQKYSIESLLNKNIQSDILTEIQLANNPGSYICWTNNIMIGNICYNKVIDNINLYLGSTDDYILDLGGLEWSCLLYVTEHEGFRISYDDTILGKPILKIKQEEQKEPEQVSSESESDRLTEELNKLKSELQ